MGLGGCGRPRGRTQIGPEWASAGPIAENWTGAARAIRCLVDRCVACDLSVRGRYRWIGACRLGVVPVRPTRKDSHADCF